MQRGQEKCCQDNKEIEIINREIERIMDNQKQIENNKMKY